MKALFDTSAYSGLMLGDPEILALLANSVVPGELYSGFRRGSRQTQNEIQLQAFLRKPSISIVDVTSETALRYAEIDSSLSSKGRPNPRNNVWIATLALEHGCVLITRDAHFRELPILPIRP